MMAGVIRDFNNTYSSIKGCAIANQPYSLQAARHGTSQCAPPHSTSSSSIITVRQVLLVFLLQLAMASSTAASTLFWPLRQP